ncbi:hypothetical protein [Bradyrhizobium embrapense]
MSDTISLQRLPPSNGWFEYHESGTFVRMLKPGRSPGLTRNGPSEGPTLQRRKLPLFPNENGPSEGTSWGREVTPEGWPASPDEETDHADDKRDRRTSRQSNDAALHTVDVIEFEHAGQSEVGWWFAHLLLNGSKTTCCSV